MRSAVRRRIRKLQSDLRRWASPPDISKYGNDRLVEVWRAKNLTEDYQSKIQSAESAHRRSADLVAFLEESGLIGELRSVHEIGCGCGRNLDYVHRANRSARLSGNDLSREACFARMSSELRELMIFTEQDTLSFLNSSVQSGHKVDALLSAGHMMHLGRDVIQDVYRLVASFADRFIILMERYGRVVDVRGSGKQFLWAADEYDNVFPGFRLARSRRVSTDDSPIPLMLMLFEKIRPSE